MNIKLISVEEKKPELNEIDLSILKEIIMEENRDRLIRKIIDILESNIATTRLLDSDIKQKLSYTVSLDTDNSFNIDVKVSYVDGNDNLIDKIEFTVASVSEAYKGASIAQSHANYLIKEFHLDNRPIIKTKEREKEDNPYDIYCDVFSSIKTLNAVNCLSLELYLRGIKYIIYKEMMDRRKQLPRGYKFFDNLHVSMLMDGEVIDGDIGVIDSNLQVKTYCGIAQILNCLYFGLKHTKCAKNIRKTVQRCDVATMLGIVISDIIDDAINSFNILDDFNIDTVISTVIDSTL